MTILTNFHEQKSAQQVQLTDCQTCTKPTIFAHPILCSSVVRSLFVNAYPLPLCNSLVTHLLSHSSSTLRAKEQRRKRDVTTKAGMFEAGRFAPKIRRWCANGRRKGCFDMLPNRAELGQCALYWDLSVFIGTMRYYAEIVSEKVRIFAPEKEKTRHPNHSPSQFLSFSASLPLSLSASQLLSLPATQQLCLSASQKQTIN